MILQSQSDDRGPAGFRRCGNDLKQFRDKCPRSVKNLTQLLVIWNTSCTIAYTHCGTRHFSLLSRRPSLRPRSTDSGCTLWLLQLPPLPRKPTPGDPPSPPRKPSSTRASATPWSGTTGVFTRHSPFTLLARSSTRRIPWPPSWAPWPSLPWASFSARSAVCSSVGWPTAWVVRLYC